MVYVLTGTNGFIGSRLAASLLATNPPVEIRALVRSRPGQETNGMVPYVVDYRRPASIVDSGALEGADMVIHLAGITKALTLEAFREGNVMPVASMLEAIRTVRPSLRRFVLVSSQAAAGPAARPGQPKSEVDPAMPFDVYGKSKYEAERILMDEAGDTPFTIVRPSAVYGPRDVDFLALFKQLRTGAGLYPANRRHRLATIFVDDLVAGLLLASRHDAARNELFFLTNEEEIEWTDVYRAVALALQTPMRFEWEIPAPIVRLVGRLGDGMSRLTGRVSVINSQKVALGMAPYWTCTSNKARHLIGFSPAMSLQDGLSATLAWYRQHDWV